MKLPTTFLAPAALLLLAACGGAGKDETKSVPVVEMARSEIPRNLNPGLSEAERSAFASDSASFAFDLYAEMLKDPGIRTGNAVWSPASVQFAFAMAYAGAQGTTADEMARVLRFSLPKDRQLLAFDALDLELAGRAATALQAARERAAPTGATVDPGDFRLHMVNAVWGDRTFRFEKPYLDALAANFGTGVCLADFHGQPEPSRRFINDWVKDQTLGRIEDLLPAGTIDAYTRAVLVNALHLKLPWAEPFPAGNTAPGTFTLRNAEAVQVPFMRHAVSAEYAEEGLFRMLSIPLAGDSIAFLVVTPRPGLPLPTDPELDAAAATALIRALQPEKIIVALPRFKFTPPGLSLKPLLQRLGMVEAFTVNAHFDGMSAEKPLCIFDALHKAMAAVDEKGIEAAAATAVVMAPTGIPARTVSIDRPFTFGIYDHRASAWLFLGHVSDPSR